MHPWIQYEPARRATTPPMRTPAHPSCVRRACFRTGSSLREVNARKSGNQEWHELPVTAWRRATIPVHRALRNRVLCEPALLLASRAPCSVLAPTGASVQKLFTVDEMERNKSRAWRRRRNKPTGGIIPRQNVERRYNCSSAGLQILHRLDSGLCAAWKVSLACRWMQTACFSSWSWVHARGWQLRRQAAGCCGSPC